MTDYNDRQTMKSRGTTNDCRVIGESAVAMEFDKLVKQAFDIIQRVWAIRMAGELNAFERGLRTLIT